MSGAGGQHAKQQQQQHATASGSGWSSLAPTASSDEHPADPAEHLEMASMGEHGAGGVPLHMQLGVDGKFFCKDLFVCEYILDELEKKSLFGKVYF